MRRSCQRFAEVGGLLVPGGIRRSRTIFGLDQRRLDGCSPLENHGYDHVTGWRETNSMESGLRLER
jgi:hypothetical protein